MFSIRIGVCSSGIPGSAVINARKVFGVRLFGHNVNKEENETSGRTVWRNYRLLDENMIFVPARGGNLQTNPDFILMMRFDKY